MDRLHILVVDDDTDINRIISEILEQNGYEVYSAFDGDTAVQIAENRLLHLIIMDVMMPKTNGLAATMKIREGNNIPILMLSAKAEESDRVSGKHRHDPYQPDPEQTGDQSEQTRIFKGGVGHWIQNRKKVS